MNLLVMSIYALLLLGNAPSHAVEPRALSEQKTIVEKEMQRWLKEHDLQQHFTEQNIIVRSQGDSHSRILLRVPEEIWNKRQHILLQSKPSFRAYMVAGVTMGSSAGGVVGGVITYSLNSRGDKALLGVMWMAIGGLCGALKGVDLYKERYSNFKAASSEITRATDLERSYCMPNVSVLLELDGLRDLLSHHRISDIGSVIMSSRKKD